MSTIGNINLAQIGIAFLFFFIFGYLLYASLFAAIGSAVENEGDSSQLQLPITIPLMLGFFVALYAFKAPDSQLVFVEGDHFIAKKKPEEFNQAVLEFLEE